MIRRLKVGAGIWTEPGALEAAEKLQGPMREADNVIFHRPAAVQPRPGFGDTTGIELTRTAFTDYMPVELAAYVTQDEIWCQSFDDTAWQLALVDADVAVTTNVVPPDVTRRGASQFMEARGSLYHTSSTGMRKLPRSADAGTHVRAGGWMTYQSPAYTLVDPGATSDRVSLDTDTADNAVAYRWVSAREDVHGYTVRSAPSSRLVVKATNALFPNGAYLTLGSINLPPEALAGDVLELYRTGNSGSGTVEPGSDYFLSKTYVVTASDITNGFTPATTWTDDVSDDALGATLYASSSQLGWASAKEVPPISQSLVWWNRCAWMANLTHRHTLSVNIDKVAYRSGVTVRLQGQGLCFVDTDSVVGNFTSGNAQILGVSFVGGFGWASVAVGQWIAQVSPNTAGDTLITPLTTIASHNGVNSITMTTTALATSSGATFAIGDIVTVDGVDFFVYKNESLTSRWVKVSHAEADHGERIREVAASLARCVSYAGSDGALDTYAVKNDILDAGDGTVLLISPRPESGAFTLQCLTRPTALSPYAYAAVTPPTILQRDQVAWSSMDEPEAWPSLQTNSVGNQDYEIVDMIALDRALLIFKQDGIYRVTGSPPNGWVFDTISTAHRLLAPRCCCVLGNVAYAFTDRGVCSITEDGTVTSISAAIDDQLREIARILPLNDTGVMRGFWMQAHPRLGLVILNTASTSALANSDTGQFVWHESTGAWSTWSRGLDRCSVYDATESRLLVGVHNVGTATEPILTWTLLYERPDEDAAESYRDRVTATVSPAWASTTKLDITRTDVTFAPVPNRDVLEVLASPSTFHEITVVTATAPLYQLTISPAGDGNSQVIVHQGYASTLLWQPAALPGTSSRWQEIHAALLDGASAFLSSWDMAIGGQSERDSAAASVDMAVTSDVVASRVVRSGVPRALARCAHFYASVAVSAAGVLWRLGELVLHHTPTSRRVVR